MQEQAAVPAPVPPDDPDAWYAPAVRSQYEVHPGVVVTVSDATDGDDFAYDVRHPRLDETDERAHLGDGVVVRVTCNASLAGSVGCPGGRGHAFGPCERDGAVVVQERANETVVVAVTFDVRVTTPSGTTRFSRVVRPR